MSYGRCRLNANRERNENERIILRFIRTKKRRRGKTEGIKSKKNWIGDKAKRNENETRKGWWFEKRFKTIEIKDEDWV